MRRERQRGNTRRKRGRENVRKFCFWPHCLTAEILFLSLLLQGPKNYIVKGLAWSPDSTKCVLHHLAVRLSRPAGARKKRLLCFLSRFSVSFLSSLPFPFLLYLLSLSRFSLFLHQSLLRQPYFFLCRSFSAATRVSQRPVSLTSFILYTSIFSNYLPLYVVHSVHLALSLYLCLSRAHCHLPSPVLL